MSDAHLMMNPTSQSPSPQPSPGGRGGQNKPEHLTAKFSDRGCESAGASQGDGDRVSDVGRAWHFVEPHLRLHRELDLPFVCVPSTGDGFLHFGRSEFENFNANSAKREQADASRMAHCDRRRRVAVVSKEFFDVRSLRVGSIGDVSEIALEFDEPISDGLFWIEPDDSSFDERGILGRMVGVDRDARIAGEERAGIDAEDSHV
jgi:hypothetical protein